jgi:triphosphoribosyl-dephospho-CoA synthetase
MTSDLDIRRSAWLIIKRYGADAAAFAAVRADALIAEGDLEGAAIWKSIHKAIEELQADKPEPGEKVN